MHALSYDCGLQIALEDQKLRSEVPKNRIIRGRVARKHYNFRLSVLLNIFKLFFHSVGLIVYINQERRRRVIL